jgi:hypothetical protein
VLDVHDGFGSGGAGTEPVATIQWLSGELDDELARSTVNTDQFERIDSGKARNSGEDACAEREHDFDAETLRETPDLARCSKCRLSRQTVQQWLKQDVPDACDVCGSLGYEIVYRGNTGRCPDCR